MRASHHKVGLTSSERRLEGAGGFCSSFHARLEEASRHDAQVHPLHDASDVRRPGFFVTPTKCRSGRFRPEIGTVRPHFSRETRAPRAKVESRRSTKHISRRANVGHQRNDRHLVGVTRGIGHLPEDPCSRSVDPHPEHRNQERARACVDAEFLDGSAGSLRWEPNPHRGRGWNEGADAVSPRALQGRTRRKTELASSRSKHCPQTRQGPVKSRQGTPTPRRVMGNVLEPAKSLNCVVRPPASCGAKRSRNFTSVLLSSPVSSR